jgi:hypothetical protein
VATYPVVLKFGDSIPGQLSDPLEHLWIMRWSESCLKAGRLPFFCPALNYPTGVPLGYFPTMHLPTAGFLALGLVTDNDVARFNVLWFFGFVATGMGSFLLAWWVIRKVGAAWLAGLGAMLTGPMLMHAHGHLETMQLGAVPLFLIGWLRFVDRPSRGRLAASVGLYWLVVASAPYFAVLAVFPAAWYVAWSVAFAGSGGRRAWILARAGWLLAFGLVVLPGLALLFSSQIWAAVHGHSMARTRSEFNQFGAPIWSSFIPSPLHALGRNAKPGFFESTGSASRMSECSSYLGVVTLGLLAYAALRRVRFPLAGFWWSALILMVVLSWGSHLQVGTARISLPAGWLYGIFPPFHLIRVPARFNLFAAVCAVVPASAALADLLGRVRGRVARGSFVIGLVALMLADMSMIPFETATIPGIPAIYQELVYRNPETAIVDAPMFGSNEGQVFSSVWEYWQSIHQLRTTAGYPGLPNAPFEAEIVRGSPFWAKRLLDPDYLSHPGSEHFGPVEGVDARDYTWLYLTAHGFDRVVLHQETWFDSKYQSGCDRIKALLADARFLEADVAIFDRATLRPPEGLTWLCGEGFRPSLIHPDARSFGVLRKARLVIFNPTPERSVVLSLVDASAFTRARVVRLMQGVREIARWNVEPGTSRTIETPPFRLEDGVQELRLESDGDDRPTRHADRLDDARTPYSLRLGAVRVRSAD